jgi:hypothetical protein
MFYAKSHVVKLVSAIPVVLSMTILILVYSGWYNYWVLAHEPTWQHNGMFYLTTGLCGMCLISYYQVLFTNPGNPPANWP